MTILGRTIFFLSFLNNSKEILCLSSWISRNTVLPRSCYSTRQTVRIYIAVQFTVKKKKLNKHSSLFTDCMPHEPIMKVFLPLCLLLNTISADSGCQHRKFNIEFQKRMTFYCSTFTLHIRQTLIMFNTWLNEFQPDNDPAKLKSSHRFYYGAPQAHVACYSVLVDRSVNHSVVEEYPEPYISWIEETLSFDEKG